MVESKRAASDLVRGRLPRKGWGEAEMLQAGPIRRSTAGDCCTAGSCPKRHFLAHARFVTDTQPHPLACLAQEAGTNDVATETLFDGFCTRLAAAGVPIARGFLSIAGLHPLRRAYSLTWNYGRSVEVTDFGHATMATAVWQTSPFRHMLETKTRRLHRRLVGDNAVLDFEVLREFRHAGMSEWLALMYGFGWSALPAANQFGAVLSWTTSTAVGRGNGWSALELVAIVDDRRYLMQPRRN